MGRVLFDAADRDNNDDRSKGTRGRFSCVGIRFFEKETDRRNLRSRRFEQRRENRFRRMGQNGTECPQEQFDEARETKRNNDGFDGVKGKKKFSPINFYGTYLLEKTTVA